MLAAVPACNNRSPKMAAALRTALKHLSILVISRVPVAVGGSRACDASLFQILGATVNKFCVFRSSFNGVHMYTGILAVEVVSTMAKDNNHFHGPESYGLKAITT